MDNKIKVYCKGSTKYPSWDPIEVELHWINVLWLVFVWWKWRLQDLKSLQQVLNRLMS